MAGPAARALSSGKGMVVPGFMDGHVHLLSGRVPAHQRGPPERRLTRGAHCSPQGVRCEADPGEWILGGGWDHERWPGSPLPKRSWIDSVTPNNPVYVNRLDAHMGLANSVALKPAGITRSIREIAGGIILRDSRGKPTAS
jgi:predicted amidohydrolase YtcJ